MASHPARYRAGAQRIRANSNGIGFQGCLLTFAPLCIIEYSRQMYDVAQDISASRTTYLILLLLSTCNGVFEHCLECQTIGVFTYIHYLQADRSDGAEPEPETRWRPLVSSK